MDSPHGIVENVCKSESVPVCIRHAISNISKEHGDFCNGVASTVHSSMPMNTFTST